MDLKKITDRAKDLVEKRGGSESLKRDAEELQGIAKGQGSFADKAKQAVSAIKDPGAAGEEPDAARTAEPETARSEEPESAAAQASPSEAERSDEKVKAARRGKHAQGTGGGGHRGRWRHGGGGAGRRGGNDDPAV